MSLLSGILQSQAPPKQDATSTIQTLCLRLTSGTLLEDRRAAIMGLRSFAKDYKELVASEGLRELIATLSKDREDLDTAKAVLETLLSLFSRDDTNPEGSEDIALWMADEFTQKQENITILIDLLEDVDFYVRLYTLQLLAAISQHRPARTQEGVLTAPLGIPRLASILEDKRDVIRNEAILLIIHISSDHTDIQKLIAFESAFERIFSIIEAEGGVEGGIVAQDCLQLLSNLLSFNVSNQSHFRETGGVPKLAKLFDLPEEEPMPFAKEQRDINIQYGLRVVRLFVVPGGLGTHANQNSLASAGILHLMLKVAFSPNCSLAVRADALKTVADLIDGNAPIQQNFSQLQVTPPDAQATAEDGEPIEYYVIGALLELALLNSSIHAFNARLAACRCLEAYFNGNPPVRQYFLQHAVHLHTSGDDSPNILTCLFNLDKESRGDPYRVWIASVVLIHLIHEDPEVKALATAVREGDSEAGEEEVTAIQSIASNLITALQHHYDSRISIGYLMLLCIWLYEDSDAVDDFLSEGGCVQSLVGAVKENGVDPAVQGLSAFLLGILYEFSHKESPVPRATLHPILAARMGRDLYVNKITTLRSNPFIRDFEVSDDAFMPEYHHRDHGLPEVYFDRIFVEFFKDNYSQILRAIDKDPGLETRVAANGVTKVSNGVSLELMDSLKAQLEEKTAALTAAENTRLALEQQLSREQHEAQRSREVSATELRKQREATEAQRRRYESDAVTKDERNRALVEEMTKRNRRGIEERDGQITASKRQIDDLTRQNKAVQNDSANLKRQLGDLEQRSKAAIEEKEFQIQGLRRQIEDMTRNYKSAVAQKDGEAQGLQKCLADLQVQLQEQQRESQAKLEETEERIRETSSWELQALQTKYDELQAKVELASREHAKALEEASKGGASKAANFEKKAKAAEDEATKARAAFSGLEAKLKKDQQRIEAAEKAKADAEARVRALVEQKTALEKARAGAEARAKDTQTELDDMLMILQDLEEKRKADKKRLKGLGQEVSEDEEDEEDEDGEDEDEDEDEDDSERDID